MALKDPSLYPVLHVMKQSMSIKWVTVELVMIIALVLFAVSLFQLIKWYHEC